MLVLFDVLCPRMNDAPVSLFAYTFDDMRVLFFPAAKFKNAEWTNILIHAQIELSGWPLEDI